LTGQQKGIDSLASKIAEKEKALEALLEEIRRTAERNDDKEQQIGSLRAQLSETTEQEHGKLAEIMSANAAAQELESRGETLYWQLKDARDRLIRALARLPDDAFPIIEAAILQAAEELKKDQ
jgi:septal ring factor EnvC (AmiA/AmiB activator)